ncbi:MAG: heavy metal-binding domain-containing protein [Bacteroidota bacterium]|nr:heavy metal-binding domain-containing protein [Bacteroidota bacterium]
MLPIILVAGLWLVDFSSSEVYGQATQPKTAKQQTVKYTCTMHPEVVRNKPGNCPKCGMKLVEKKNISKGKMHQTKNTGSMKHSHKKMMCDSTKMKK